MKIQEMRSGSLHLNKKMERERPEKFYRTLVVGEPIPEDHTWSPPDAESELDEPLWSVISFEQCEAGGLTYNQAAALISELESHGVAGLCIVTHTAAARIGS
ncbi:MAG: hypothetical protein ABIO36_09145 [Pyrinomonadaceae bacterium]